MTVNTVIQTMSQLTQLHESLLSLSMKKTEALKTNDTEGLQKLLTQERKHVQAINQVDHRRSNAVEEWYESRGLKADQPTMSEMLGYAEGSEEEQFEEAYESMVLILAQLKEQEQLNKELTQQSLQFIQLSLDMLQPSIVNVNYGSKKPTEEQPNRSMFDSKA